MRNLHGNGTFYDLVLFYLRQMITKHTISAFIYISTITQIDTLFHFDMLQWTFTNIISQVIAS